MRTLALAFLGLWLAAVTVAQENSESWRFSPKPIRESVCATVEGQLLALRAGKFDEAYAFAAHRIRRQFTLPVFAAMIRRGYPAQLAHQRFEAGLVRDNRDRRAQVVYSLFDAGGGASHFRYELLHEEGRWRIESVVATTPDKQTGI
jgi:hypothetical protein